MSSFAEVTMMKESVRGTAVNLSLKDFRARVEAKRFDQFDFGACSCVVGE